MSRKNTIRLIICLLISVTVALVLTVSCYALYMQKAFDNSLYGNVIRLHVLANSDSEYDQNAKLEIKDAVLMHIQSITSQAENCKSASRVIEENLQHITDFVRLKSQELGYEYDIAVSFEKEHYPVRNYGAYTFPSGEYSSLKITLGKADGKNWWCVLYPAICTSPAQEFSQRMKSAGVSDEVCSYITDDEGSVKVKFFLLELFQKIV